MKKKINICRICLRLDRKLNPVHNELLELYDELCEYSDYTLNPLYCWECEYLLKKTYSFKSKCIKAIKLFDHWTKSKENDKPEHLWTQLPISLGFWLHRDKIASFQYEYDEDHNASTLSNSNAYKNNHNDIFINDKIKTETEFKADLKDDISTESTHNNIDESNIQENNIKVVEISNSDCIKKECNGFAEYSEPRNDCGMIKDTKLCEKIESFDDFSVFDDNNDNDAVDSDDSLSLIALKMKNRIKKTKSTKKSKDIANKNITNLKKKLTKSDKSSKRKKAKLEQIQFSKERLRLELEAKFSAWGELRTDDGTVIDKDVILSCLNDKITDERMKQLWDSIQCENPEPITLRTFKHLTRLYTNEELYTSVFEIEYLNTDQKMLEELERRKTYECYIKAKYKCDKCYLVFYKPKHLGNHVKMHEVTAGNFVCKICNLRYTSSKNYRGHMLAHSAVYRCKLCPLVTYYRDSMVNHYNQHQGKAYTCEECGHVSKSMSGYKRHQYLQHRRGRHVCTACGRAFVSSLGVSLHRKRMHQNEAPPPEGATPVTCAECDLSFPSEEVFLKHKRTWHQAHKNDKSARGYNYKRPRKEKPVAPNITCRICGASGSIGWLSLHFRTDHPTLNMDSVYADKRKHLCHVCAKGFWNATSLRYHLNTHTGHRPYACDLCPKRCFSSIALNEHRLRHFPPSKECKQCGKKFRTQSNLHNHMLFHTGTRRHKCTICGKAFLHSTSLNEHVRGVHYNVRRAKRGPHAADNTAQLALNVGDVSD